jgi:hypothetical protein
MEPPQYLRPPHDIEFVAAQCSELQGKDPCLLPWHSGKSTEATAARFRCRIRVRELHPPIQNPAQVVVQDYESAGSEIETRNVGLQSS